MCVGRCVGKCVGRCVGTLWERGGSLRQLLKATRTLHFARLCRARKVPSAKGNRRSEIAHVRADVHFQAASKRCVSHPACSQTNDHA